MKYNNTLAIKDGKMSRKILFLSILSLLAVLVVSGLLLIIGLQSRLPRFSYQPTEPLVLAVGTSDSKDDDIGGSIWLIQITRDGPVAKYELATPASHNDTVNHSGLFLIECPSLPATVCGYEQVKGTATQQMVKVHQWQVVWPLDKQVTAQHEEHLIAIPASAQVTGIVREGILFQSRSDLSVNLLRFSDQSMTTVASTGKCSDERTAQRLSSRLSPNGNSLAYACVSPLLPFSQGHAKDSPSDQYLAVMDLSTGDEHRLSPETLYFYDGACNLYVVSAFPPYCKYLPLIWSPDGTQIAFVTALTAPIKLPGTKWPPDYQDAGAIYSVALDGTQWHEWAMTKGQTPYLDWSPDKQYLAYGLTDLNIASFTGGNWKIRDTELIQGLDWSPDGSYIALRYFMSGAEIVRTSDYTWQSVEVPGRVTNMLWLTPPAP
jgi:WD40 repeat protein